MKQTILSILLSLLTFAVQAQTRTITGTIINIDEGGETVIGCTVRLKGSNDILDVSDINGEYSLTFEPGESEPVLVFSYLGCKTQEIKVGQSDTINVAMQEEKYEITGHPIIAYTLEMKQRDMTAAVVRVVRHRHIPHSMRGINGIISGLYVQSDNDLFTLTPNIRSGIGNIGGEVRTMVDGIVDAPYNFADLLSMTALKAPHAEIIASTATAPGGLLQLTTKDYNAPKSFEIDTWVGFYDDELNTGIIQHYGVRFSDSSERLKMHGSVNYDNINGTIGNTKGERFTPRLRFEYRPTWWARISQTGYYDWQKQQRDWLYDGDLAPFKNNTRNEVFSASTVELSPWEWLTVNSVYTYDRIDSQGDRINNNYWRSGYRDYFDFRNQENSLADRWMWDNTISVTQRINYDHNLLLSGSFTRDETTIKTILPIIPDQREESRSKITDNLLLTGHYNYKRIRVLNASLRQLSSSLPTKDNAKVQLPSFAAAWRIFEEEPLRDISSDYNVRRILSSIKINAGWGQSAHIGLNLPTAATDGSGYPNFVCQDLKWQVTTQKDASMEAAFLDNKLSLSAGYYHKTTNHLLENRPSSPGGTMNIYSGDAQVLNKGWEFDARFSTWNKLSWDVRASLTINNSSLKNVPTTNAQPLLGNFIAPKYNYGVWGDVNINKFILSMHFNGIADMYVPVNAFAAPAYPVSYAKVNSIALKSVQLSYMFKYNRYLAIGRLTEAYINAENLLYLTNSSLKGAGINYAAYPINQMISLGLKIRL